MKNWIGIDPGKNGGVAVADETGRIVSIIAMPPDIKELYDYLRQYKKFGCILEDVHSMPTDGVASAFTFGHNVGGIEAVLNILNIKYTKVRPSVWMKSFGFVRDKDNESKYAFKKRIYEYAKQLTNLKLHQNQADAVMLSLYRGKNDRKSIIKESNSNSRV